MTPGGCAPPEASACGQHRAQPGDLGFGALLRGALGLGLGGPRTLARLPGFLQADEITLTPDWVCEVLSPSTSRFDRKRKLPIYHREGVGHAWLLDPA